MKMFYFFLCYVIAISMSYSMDLIFLGETNFKSDKNSEKLYSKIGPVYRLNLYETNNKKFLFYFSGKTVIDYDHFGGELKTNTFSVLGIDF